MSEIKNYIILSFQGEHKEVKLPSNFDELKNIFFEKFNEDTSKNLRFLYFDDDTDFPLTEENFSEGIEKVRNLDNQIYVHEIEEEDEAMKQVVNFSQQFPKNKENKLMRQNALKKDEYTNNLGDENLIEKVDDGKNQTNNLEEKISCHNKDKSDNKNYDYLKIKSIEVLKESENNPIKLEEKEKELELTKENNNNEYNDLSKVLEEEKNKYQKDISTLENKLKELEAILQNEKKEKMELINDKKDLELKYQSLENKFNQSKLISSKEEKSHKIAQLKSKNLELIETMQKKEKELEEKTAKLDKLKDKYHKLKEKQNESGGSNDCRNIIQENRELKEKIDEINKVKDLEIEKLKNKITDLEEQIKISRDKDKIINNSISTINLNKENKTNYNINNSDTGNISTLFNTVIMPKDDKLCEKIKAKQIQRNEKRQKRSEFINKKLMEKDMILFLDKKTNIEEEKNYIEKVNIQKSKIKQKNENRANNINNNENYEIILSKDKKLKEIQKQITEKNQELKNKEKIIENLNKELEKIKEQNPKNLDFKLPKKTNEEYEKKIKDFKDQINEMNKIIKMTKEEFVKSENDKAQYFSKLESLKQNLKDCQEQLNQKNNIINQLNQEKMKLEIDIKEFQDKIELYKSELTKSQSLRIEKNNEQKKEFDQKIIEYQNALESKYKQIYQEEIKKTIENINNNIKTKNETLQNKYEMYYKKMENNYNQKFNQISNLIIQNNAKKCQTIHEGVKCFQCLKSPIVGIRYKCINCKNYNLCENCEDKNSESGTHPHLFIKIRKREPNVGGDFVDINKFEIKEENKNHNFNNKGNDEFQIIKFEKEEQYSFECLDKQNLKAQINFGEDELNMEILIKNNGKTVWPVNEAKLVFDERKNLVGKDIVLNPQKVNEEIKYNVYFKDLKPYPPGNYNAGLFFEVNGKKYGDDIDLNITIIEKKEENDYEKQINDFRNEYNLDRKEYPDEKILTALKKFNFNVAEAFDSLFE